MRHITHSAHVNRFNYANRLIIGRDIFVSMNGNVLAKSIFSRNFSFIQHEIGKCGGNSTRWRTGGVPLRGRRKFRTVANDGRSTLHDETVYLQTRKTLRAIRQLRSEESRRGKLSLLFEAKINHHPNMPVKRVRT